VPGTIIMMIGEAMPGAAIIMMIVGRVISENPEIISGHLGEFRNHDLHFTTCHGTQSFLS